MREGTASLIRREDYAAPAFWIKTVDLTFDLDPGKTLVINKMTVEPNLAQSGSVLRLDGEDINLTRVLVDGEPISFRFEEQQLVLENLPRQAFSLEIRSTCAPEKNTHLSGLYTSSGGFFTQCEALGFRRITYFLDRPDVMATYKVTLKADKLKYPVLLSNGNLIEEGAIDGARHYAVWEDPNPKP
jgi:aminopeptidase N